MLQGTNIKLKFLCRHYRGITEEWGVLRSIHKDWVSNWNPFANYYLFYKMPPSTQFFQNDSYSSLALDLFKALGGLQIKAEFLILGSYCPPHIKDLFWSSSIFPQDISKPSPVSCSTSAQVTPGDTRPQPRPPQLMCWHICTVYSTNQTGWL